MTPRLLPRPKWRVLGFTALCLFFVGTGALMIVEGQPFGWFVAGFFGLGAPIFLAQLFGKSGVEVDGEGFTVRTLFKARRYLWKDVSEFSVYRIHGSSMIIFDDATDDGLMSKINHAVIGPNAAIPAILVAGPIESVCADLNTRRAAALSAEA